jgi:hypothetical protein
MLLKTKFLDVGEDKLIRLDIGLTADFGIDPGLYRIGRHNDPEDFEGGFFLSRGSLFSSLMLSFWLGTKVGFQISEGDESEDEGDDNMDDVPPSDSGNSATMEL